MWLFINYECISLLVQALFIFKKTGQGTPVKGSAPSLHLMEIHTALSLFSQTWHIANAAETSALMYGYNELLFPGREQWLFSDPCSLALVTGLDFFWQRWWIPDTPLKSCWVAELWVRLGVLRNILSLPNHTKPLSCLTNCLYHRLLVWGRFDQALKSAGQCKASIWSHCWGLDWVDLLCWRHKPVVQTKTLKQYDTGFTTLHSWISFELSLSTFFLISWSK